MTGLTLAQYRIESELGRGGMGIVYRATDTKLGRTVALKILPVAALSSEDDRARFFREAQAAAQLSHPNIAGVHQIDEAIPVDDEGRPVGASDGPRPFIAMEFIEGETLAARVKRGPFALREAVTVAGQVAEALKAAHAKNIVHRDIKSANVMLTPEGVAKVLDFGLAKTNQSTMLTRMGSTLGTVAYMSPEQARGNDVDGRTDLYSLGTMLYEMVAGRLPFAGDYEQAVLYSILNEPPEPLTAVRTGVPMELERITAKLLSKEAEYRYQTAADLIADLKALDVSGSGVSRRSMPTFSGTAVAAAPKAETPQWILVVIVVAALVVGGGVGGWLLSTQPPPKEIVRSQLLLRTDGMQFRRLSLSADGRVVSGMAGNGGGLDLYVRRLEETETRVLDVGLRVRPLHDLSPDGRWLAYGTREGLFRVPVDGGSPQLISRATGPSVAWFSDDEIWVAGPTRLVRVRLNGDTTSVSIAGFSDRPIWQASPLPGDGRALVTITVDGTFRALAVDARAGTGVLVGPAGAAGARYHPAGYLVYLLGGDLYAARFDTDTFEMGPAFVVQPGVGSYTNSGASAPTFDISEDILVYVSGEDAVGLGGSVRISSDLQIFSPFGPADAGLWDPRFSPDGTQLLTHGQIGGDNSDIWLADLQRGTLRRLTNEVGEQETALWSFSGKSFFYTSDSGSGTVESVVRQTIDNSAPVDTLYAADNHMHVESVSRDDRWLILTLRGPTSGDTYALDTQNPGQVIPLLTGSANETNGQISPDGTLLAYRSDETGSDEIYVARFPDMVAPEVVSVGGGVTPLWSRSGRFLYYRTEAEVIRIPFTNGRAGAPERVGVVPEWIFRNSGHRSYDVFGDGERFAFIAMPGGDVVGTRPVEMVTGFGELLRRLDPNSAR